MILETSDYHYTESGLRNIWLANGFDFVETRYGRGISIHDVPGLHTLVGKLLAHKHRLTGAELRFLRKEMGLSQRALGELLGASDQAVAKWEKTSRIPKTADRMTRLIYLKHMDGNAPIRATIECINDTDNAVNERIVAEESETGWKIAA